MKRKPGGIREGEAPYGATGGTISSKGQITIPKGVRERCGLTPGTRVEFEVREGGALVRRRRPERHPAWDQIGSLRDTWRWPRGIPKTVDAYIDYVRGGSFAQIEGRPAPSKRKGRKR